MFAIIKWLSLATLVSAYFISETTAGNESEYYTAGVVEFHNSRANSSQLRLQDNLRGYIDIITSDEAKDTDIIVFPESTLNSQEEYTHVPHPEEHIAPCDFKQGKYHDFLVELSCTARNVSKYIVINLSERDACIVNGSDPRPCARSGFNLFNTNVVLDRSGTVISRYRKVNLWGENGNNVTYIPEYGHFETDFGVHFGHFVCYDYLFYTPVQAMIDHMNITHFLAPAMWFAQLPFLTTIQTQFAFAYGNDVTLLAAEASNPDIGSTGSGIYSGRDGILNSFQLSQGKGVRKIITARVPKERSRRHLPQIGFHTRSISTASKPEVEQPNARLQAVSDPLYLKRDLVEFYKSVLLDLNNGTSFERLLCTNTLFCCHFKLEWRNLNPAPNTRYYKYRLGVFDGLRSDVAPTSNQLKNCAIFACLSDDIMDCGKYFEGQTKMDLSMIEPQVAFEHIELEATFPKTKTFSIMPNSLVSSTLLPVPMNNFEWTESDIDSTRVVRFVLNTTTDDLLTFSIYGNYFDSKTNGGLTLVHSTALLICTLILSNFI